MLFQSFGSYLSNGFFFSPNKIYMKGYISNTRIKFGKNDKNAKSKEELFEWKKNGLEKM